jgi:hypothetical protein
MSPTLSLAQHLALAATGLFFLNGLLTGVWKYAQMRGGDHAHYYVNIAHRTSLMYAFACLLLERFAALSAWSAPVNTAAVIASVAFFAMAVVTYQHRSQPAQVGAVPIQADAAAHLSHLGFVQAGRGAVFAGQGAGVASLDAGAEGGGVHGAVSVPITVCSGVSPGARSSTRATDGGTASGWPVPGRTQTMNGISAITHDGTHACAHNNKRGHPRAWNSIWNSKNACCSCNCGAVIRTSGSAASWSRCFSATVSASCRRTGGWYW